MYLPQSVITYLPQSAIMCYTVAYQVDCKHEKMTSSLVFASISDHVLRCGLASRSVIRTYQTALLYLALLYLALLYLALLYLALLYLTFHASVNILWWSGTCGVMVGVCRVLVGPDHLQPQWAELASSPYSLELVLSGACMTISGAWNCHTGTGQD